MTTKRMKANDYRIEYDSLNDSLAILEKRIEMRFLTLCKQYPDVCLYRKSNINPMADGRVFISVDVVAGSFTHKHVAALDTNAMIRFIGVIEKYIADKHPHKQTSIEFPETQHEKLMNIAKGIQALNIPKSKHHV